jgi:hypothetical protein
MPSLKGIRCTIRTDDGELPEYSLPGDDGSVVYVEAKTGASFWIRCQVLLSYEFTLGNYIGFYPHIDGEEIQGIGISKKRRIMPVKLEGRSCISGGDVFVQKFKFSEIHMGICLVIAHSAKMMEADKRTINNRRARRAIGA